MTDRLRVVDFSTHISGPHASQTLYQLLNADVVKIENARAGDGNHFVEPLIRGRGMYHCTLNAGTRSLAIDRRIHSEEWHVIVEAAVKWAEVVIVGGRPEDAAKRGIGFDRVSEINPQIVYCLLTGYGEDGPWAGYPAHGLNPELFAGRVQMEWVDGNPIVPTDFRSAGTTLSAMFGAMGILGALYKRDRGEGAQKVHSSMWQTALWWNWRDIACWANIDEPWLLYKDLGDRYTTYATADDKAILVAPTERKFWEAFCDALDLPPEWKSRGEWSATHGDTGKDYGEFDTIAERMKTKTLAEWQKLLTEADVPWSPVLSLVDAINSDHAEANRVLINTDVQGGDVKIAAFSGRDRQPARHEQPQVRGSRCTTRDRRTHRRGARRLRPASRPARRQVVVRSRLPMESPSALDASEELVTGAI